MLMERLGIIAGGGPLPIMAARDARMQGLKVVAVAVEEAASADLADEVDAICWVGVGKVPLDLLFSRAKIDLAGLLFYWKLKDRRGDTILAGVGDLLAEEGITLHDCRRFLSSILLRKGVLTARAPRLEEQQDIDFGRELARSMAQLRIGQTVVVKRRTVLAVEAIEGTDAAIRRGGTLGNRGVVVVKVGRPDQDMRFDLPVIGPETVAALEDAGATALALDADHTLILDRDKVVARADRLGLTIVVD
jgi:DUF1009 family protein